MINRVIRITKLEQNVGRDRLRRERQTGQGRGTRIRQDELAVKDRPARHAEMVLFCECAGPDESYVSGY